MAALPAEAARLSEEEIARVLNATVRAMLSLPGWAFRQQPRFWPKPVVCLPPEIVPGCALIPVLRL